MKCPQHCSVLGFQKMIFHEIVLNTAVLSFQKKKKKKFIKLS